MIMQIYSIWDSKVAAFLPPFYCRTDGEAIRNFTAAAMDQNHQFAKYAEDYTLFGIGEFDDSSGEIVNYQANNPLGTALQHRDRVIAHGEAKADLMLLEGEGEERVSRQ